MAYEVIWADDTDNLRRIMVDMFQSQCGEAGLEVVVDEVKSGQELVERVRSNGYVLAFTDYSMTRGFTGIDAIKQIRADESDKSVIPIYLLSLHDTLSQVAKDAGATGYGIKSEIEDMHKLMDRVIDLHLKQHKNHYDVIPLL